MTIECIHKKKALNNSERTTLGLGHVRNYSICESPIVPLGIATRLGQVVSKKDGCGPDCKGYQMIAQHARPIYASQPVATYPLGLKWIYGVTTVPSRRETHLLRTLSSLKLAGFDKPRLFVDGCENSRSWIEEFDLAVTCRSPALRVHGNWVLALYELYIREPNADRYAIFQDDIIAIANLRTYLEKVPYPEKGYLNLYTFSSNDSIAPSRDYVGFYPSNQLGKGALALVFDRPAVMNLLSSWHLVERVQDPARGHKSIDGGVVTALSQLGFKEYVHIPSLVQHTGEGESTIGNLHQGNRLAPSFPGEKTNAMSFLAPLSQVTKSTTETPSLVDPTLST